MNRLWLECLVCGARYAIGPKWTGCEECGSAGKPAPLGVRYDYASIQPRFRRSTSLRKAVMERMYEAGDLGAHRHGHPGEMGREPDAPLRTASGAPAFI